MGELTRTQEAKHQFFRLT